MAFARNIAFESKRMVISEGLAHGDGNLVNVIQRPLLSPENMLILQKAMDDGVRPAGYQRPMPPKGNLQI